MSKTNIEQGKTPKEPRENKPPKAAAQHEGGRVSFSIRRKLNSKMFWRLLGIFISIDIALCLIAGVTLIVFAEQRVLDPGLKVISAAEDSWSLHEGEDELQSLSLSNMTLTRADEQSTGAGARFFEIISAVFPHEVRYCTRYFRANGDLALVPETKITSIEYVVVLPHEGHYVEMAIDVSATLEVLRYAFLALLIIEFIMLLDRTAKNRRMVRKMLRPISELAMTAQTLNRAVNQLDPEKMAAIAGKLENIDAERLDTRIQVDDTQKELQSLATAINSMLDRIHESYRAQARFVSDASHELRTPISVIQGYANLLDRWGKNDEKTLQESIEAIKEEAASMKELVEQLLFLARGDSNTLVLDVERFELAEFCTELVSETKMIDLTHEFELRTVPCIVTADRSLIKQAMRILIDNAIKYTDPGGSIRLTGACEDDAVRLSVTDTGIGVPAESVPLIFERFYRTDDSRARATGGAGLGLSIAKWIAARHGGHMEVVSREGIGTKITIALPAASGEPITEEPIAATGDENAVS